MLASVRFLTLPSPLLLDRNVGAGVAILTSVRVVLRNPVTMAMWGLIIAGLLVTGTGPVSGLASLGRLQQGEAKFPFGGGQPLSLCRQLAESGRWAD
jgi:hypothetical protein